MEIASTTALISKFVNLTYASPYKPVNKMMECSDWVLVFPIVLILFTLLMIGLTLTPCCNTGVKERNEEAEFTTAWNRMNIIPHHDTFSLTIPPVPPYFFIHGMDHDKFATPV